MLTERAAAGNNDALKELMSRYRPKALDAACGLCDNLDEAEDLVQDTYIKVWQSISTLGPPYSFWPWLYQIMRNTWANKTKAVESGPWLRHYYDPSPNSRTDAMVVLADDRWDLPISRQVQISKRKSQKRTIQSLDAMLEAGLDIASESMDPAVIFERKEAYLAVLARLDTLPEKQRECCKLALDGYSYDEIAEKMGLAPTTVRRHMQEGRKKLEAMRP